MKSFFRFLILGLLLLSGCGQAVPDTSGGQGNRAAAPSAAMNGRLDSPGMNAEAVQAGDRAPAFLAGAPADRAIRRLTAVDEVAQHLAGYPDWEGEAWPEDDAGRVWGIDLSSPTADEWLGWGQVDVVSGEVLDYFVPRELTPAEFQAGLAEVEPFVLRDAEVLARLGDPAAWEFETSFNRWDQQWETWFWRGLDEFGVIVSRDEDGIWLDSIVDPNAFAAEEAAALARDTAVSLAYAGPGIDQALDGIDNWKTYVSDQGSGRYLVEFATAERLLYYALVDVDAETVIEAGQ